MESEAKQSFARSRFSGDATQTDMVEGHRGLSAAIHGD
jgi:hypothetical protein